MTEIKRKLLETYSNPIFEHVDDMNAYLDNFENRIEKQFMNIFNNLYVYAVIKTDRKSLPYTDEVILNGQPGTFKLGLVFVKK